MSRLIRLAVTATLAAALAAPAAAASTTTTTTTPTADRATGPTTTAPGPSAPTTFPMPSTAALETLRDNFAELARAMTGIIGPELRIDTTVLDARLADFDDYVERIARQPSLDAVLTRTGARYATALAGLRVPALGAPVTPTSPEATAFGTLFAATLAKAGAMTPKLFDELSANVASPAAQSAWSQALRSAWRDVNADLTRLMPSPCSAVMLAAMGSGDTDALPTSRDCGSCAAVGVYLHQGLTRLIDPALTSTLTDPADGLLTPSEWSNLSAWQSQVVATQNREAFAARTRAPAATSCVSTSAAPVVRQALPGVFSALER